MIRLLDARLNRVVGLKSYAWSVSQILSKQQRSRAASTSSTSTKALKPQTKLSPLRGQWTKWKSYFIFQLRDRKDGIRYNERSVQTRGADHHGPNHQEEVHDSKHLLPLYPLLTHGSILRLLCILQSSQFDVPST